MGAGEGRPSYRPCRLSRSAWLVSPFLTNPTVGRSAGSAMDPDDPAHRMRTIFGFQFDPSRRTVARSIEVPIKWGFLGHFRYPSRKHTHKEDGRIKYALSRVCVVCGRSRPQLHRKPVFMGVFAICRLFSRPLCRISVRTTGWLCPGPGTGARSGRRLRVPPGRAAPFSLAA